MSEGQKQVILQIHFTDAITGEVVKANIAMESWDNLTVITEQRLAEYFKAKGLRKDLG